MKRSKHKVYTLDYYRTYHKTDKNEKYHMLCQKPTNIITTITTTTTQIPNLLN